MDTRRWGPGERMVFEPYTREVYDETFKWIAEHGIFADTGMGSGNYAEAVLDSRAVNETVLRRANPMPARFQPYRNRRWLMGFATLYPSYAVAVAWSCGRVGWVERSETHQPVTSI